MKNFIRSWVTLLLVMIVCMGYTQNPVTVTKNISGGYTVSFSGKTETVPGLFYNTNGTTSINLYTSTNLPRPVLSRPLFPILSVTPSNWVINGHNGYTTVNQVTAALDSLILIPEVNWDELDTTYVKVADGFQLGDSVYFKDETYSKAELNNLLRYYPRRLETVTNARIDHTGTTNETTLVTITIPAERIGPNGRVIFDLCFNATNSATNKVVRIRDQSTYPVYSSGNVTTSPNSQVIVKVSNRNSLTSQVSSQLYSFGNNSATTVYTSTHNSASGLTFTLTGQCSGSASDHIYIESFHVYTEHGGN